MAIIFPGRTKCPLCDSVIEAGDCYVATSAFIHNPAHQLWPFSDAAIHQSCFISWDMRGTFVEEHNNYHASLQTGLIMLTDGTFKKDSI